MKLRVLTYNIHRAIGVDRLFRPARVVDVIRSHRPDVVILQEVDQGVPRSRELDMARDLARELGFPHRAAGYNVSLRKGRYGNATLSRFPIVRERNIDLTIGLKKRRGCQHTTIDLGTGSERPLHLELFNLHLGLSNLERQRQVGKLIRSPEFKGMEEGAPCVLAGDFNDWRSVLRFFFIEAFDFRCASDRQTKRGPRAIKTYPSFSPRGGLDRIYYRGRIELEGIHRCAHQTSRVASDHLPLIANFRIR